MIPLAEWLARQKSATVEPEPEVLPPILEPVVSADAVEIVAGDCQTDSLEEAMEARLRILRAELEQASAAEHAIALASLAERLATQIGDGFQALETRLGAAVADALSPIFTAETIARAHDAFLAAVAQRISDGGMGRIVLQAPEALALKLRERLSGTAVEIRHEDAAGCEAHASYDDAVIETRIRDWLAEAGLAAT